MTIWCEITFNKPLLNIPLYSMFNQRTPSSNDRSQFAINRRR